MPSRSISLYSLFFSPLTLLFITCLIYANPSSLDLSLIFCLGQLRADNILFLKSDHVDAEQTRGYPWLFRVSSEPGISK